VIEAMTLDEDQSCQALKAAWMKNTARRTIASAKFAMAGGCPSGFQETNTSIDPTRRMEPKPLKKYPNIC
jgi:2-methylcitrate dehydratase PrpD